MVAVSQLQFFKKIFITTGKFIFLLRAQLTAPADVGSPCQYDEGSPLVQTIGTTSYAIGIMSKVSRAKFNLKKKLNDDITLLFSKNNGCGSGFAPTIYTRLTAYYAWLNKNGGLQPAP